ncbi:MAG: LysR family transcriptional regulator [Roseibium sp.]|uniref:LysR substrate-binding domain-containing protein n=1 Tax=Roseibium sp. TaxID=1936156 RepID=UPI00261B8961|nr:LysR substrate-binding domain-containing protein [Roseibium sp.]MCV0428547.1 LysR family transcriptional regulator [Roseibium sp.]
MKPNLESDLLRTLVAIAETRNFTRASEFVGRTQSAVSIQMKKLEDIVGERLFERGPRGVSLTQSGEQLVKDARRILSLLDQAAASLQADPLDGFVRIGIPEEYGGTILPRVLFRFSKMHPQVEVTVRCAPSSELHVELERGELDLIVVHEEAAKIGGEILLNDPVVWVTSDTHLQHECVPMPVAACDRGCWWREWALASLDQHQKDYRVAYVSGSSFGLQAAVSSGIAVAVLAQSQIPPDCRELTLEEGFPPLQGTNIVLRKRTQAKCKTTEGMAQAIREAFQLFPVSAPGG